MVSKIKQFIIDFYTKEKELDITLFKLLGTAGILISLIGCIQSLVVLSDYVGAGINLLAALASLGLVCFVHTTKKYVIGYLITSVGIFMGLFTWLFFEMGGLNGSMPYFFAFGIIFTLLMYKGILLYIMETVQILYYLGVCIFGYTHPEYITGLDTAESQFADQLMGILFSSLCIGLIFLMYLREYRKQQNVAEETSKAKSVLLANISHEVRTPINMLLGMNEMILRESENTQISEYAQNVDSAGRQLLFMVNQFLDLSRIDMGKESLFEEDFNILKMVQSLGAFFRKEAEKKGLDFVMDVDRNIPENVNGDMRKLSQIISNLLTNAVKYTSSGTIVFTVMENEKVKTSDNLNYNIHFEISDTGNGISEADQKKIFENFERADLIRNRGIEGTGLGLAISNKLANLMGSEIKVKSQQEMGSVFWLDVELKPGQETEAQPESDSFFIAPEARILAVDDNNMNLLVVKSLLKRTMIPIDTAESAVEAYEKYEEKDYDLVLMDYMMPNIDGIEAMLTLREMDAAKKRHTPIIVLTADATQENKKLFYEKGFDDYLLKPVESRVLEYTIRKFLPESLVTVVNDDTKNVIPQKTRAAFEILLRKYDVSLEMALKHLSGDILQFARVCEYFVNSTQQNIRTLNSYMDAGDYENATILVHSVKGNAGNVGGDDLYYSARRLEKRLKDKDSEYAVSALPLFIMKWNRVENGLKEFLKEFNKIKPDIIKDKDDAGKSMSEAELWDALLEAVRMGNQSPALKYVDELVRQKGNSKEMEEIKESIRNIEFDKAEDLISNIKK